MTVRQEQRIVYTMTCDNCGHRADLANANQYRPSVHWVRRNDDKDFCCRKCKQAYEDKEATNVILR